MGEPIFGVDYSWARPGGAALAAVGYQFAVRYVPYPGHSGKGLTVAELMDLHEHGIAVALVFESTAERPLGGYEAGVYDAMATVKACDALGWPDGRPVYFAVDFDIQPAQYPALTGYMQGVVSVLGVARVGVYGGIRALEHCAANGLATWFWQALAWSGGRRFKGRHMYQYLNGQTVNGGEVDLNAAYFEDYGQWAGEENAMPDPRVDDILRFLGGAEAVKRWLEKGNIGLIDAFTAEQKARGEATNAINSRVKLIDDHIANHSGQGSIPDHQHEPGKVVRK